MDSRVSLLRAFAQGFAPGVAKVETERFGFAFLEQMLAGGGELEYGELTATRLLHKYKLVNLPDRRMDELLEAHVAKAWNVCRYFGAAANDVFCFNLDNNHRSDNTRVIPEMDLAVRSLRNGLRELGCEPLILASGRGFHVWGRLDQPVENGRLYRFMLQAAVRALLGFRERGYDHHKIKFNFYPDVRVHDVVSLRLFGSDHAKNRVFSHVFTPEGLLDESASWTYFEDFLRTKTMTAAAFAAASDTLAARLSASEANSGRDALGG
jgi:hypothetical protein